MCIRDRPGANVDNKSESVPGVNAGEIYAVCTDGRRVQGNFVMGSGTTRGTGPATDTKGNVYKVLFCGTSDKPLLCKEKLNSKSLPLNKFCARPVPTPPPLPMWPS